MIKQYVLTIEAPDEKMISLFVDLLNKQAKTTESVIPFKIHVEENKGDVISFG